jgi:dTDP-4-dehydrorhamnose reductase
LLADTSAQIASRFLFQDSEDIPCGVYHLTAGGKTSWHGFARYVVEKAVGAGLGLQACADSILPISTRDYPTPAVRPANSRLETDKFRKTFGLQSPDWTQGVDQVLDVILSK